MKRAAPHRAIALSGFTFLELMIVIVLLAILVAVALPRMGGAFQNSQLRSTSRELTTTLRYARYAAVLRNKATEVRFDPLAGTFRLLPTRILSDGSIEDDNDLDDVLKEEATRDKDDESFRLTADTTQLRLLPKDIFFTTIASAAPPTEKDNLPRIVFYPDGTATAGTVGIQNKRKQAYTLEVFRTTGLTRLRKGEPIIPEETVPLYVGAERTSYEGYR